MIITVGGSAGSGKSTLAKDIAKEFRLKYISVGKIMRNMAAERGLSLLEFSAHAEQNPEIDREIDQRQKEAAKEDCVVDGRLSAHLLKPDFSIWLTAPLDRRVERIAGRENIPPEEAWERIIERGESERKRYREIYNIDLDNLEIYSLVIDNGKLDIEGTKALAVKAIKNLKTTSHS